MYRQRLVWTIPTYIRAYIYIYTHLSFVKLIKIIFICTVKKICLIIGNIYHFWLENNQVSNFRKYFLILKSLKGQISFDEDELTLRNEKGDQVGAFLMEIDEVEYPLKDATNYNMSMGFKPSEKPVKFKQGEHWTK